MSIYRSIFSLASSTANVFSCAMVGTGIALFGFSANTLAASANDIALSYEADGACFCTDAAFSSPNMRTILPTPVGGQSIAQICERIGKGPGLKILDGLYDKPAYSDLQCGNGTSREAAIENETTCTGLTAPGESSCKPAGALWDLAQAFSSDNSAISQQVTPGEVVYENSSSNKGRNSQAPRSTQTDSTDSDIVISASIASGLSEKEVQKLPEVFTEQVSDCLLYTSPSPRDS